MKVSELRDALALADDNAQVIIQKDAEGNGYSPLYGVDLAAVYVPETTWYGIAYPLDSSAEDNCMDEDEWSAIKGTTPPCVVLFPVN